jgi:hypothetical protein
MPERIAGETVREPRVTHGSAYDHVFSLQFVPRVSHTSTIVAKERRLEIFLTDLRLDIMHSRMIDIIYT